MTDKFEAAEKLIQILMDAVPDTYPGKKTAIELGFVNSIKDLFLEAFDYSALCEWLAKRDMNPFYEFNSAEFVFAEETDADEFAEKMDDCLMVNDSKTILCMNW